MRARAAFAEGVRRVNSAPLLLVGMFLVTLFLALPLAIALGSQIEAHLGDSLAAETAAAGVNYDWWQEFAVQASGLASTFVPGIIGFGAVLENLSSLLDNAPLASTIAGATALWLVVWSFLSGGIVDRYARGRPTRATGFFAAAGTHFWRFLRLGVVAGVAYYALFGWVHGWLLEDLFELITHDFTTERAAFAVRLGGYAIFGALLVLCSLIFDYARIRIVVEDRRSAVGAIVAAATFVRRERGAFALYLLNSLAFVLLVLVYALVDPGAAGSGAAVLWTFILGEAFIFARHYLKLLFYASQTALFQSAVAHAAYTAAPAVVWPDSPAAEAILNSEPRTG